VKNQRNKVKEMNTLWFAFGIYIIGIATALFLRPSIMFRPGKGTWKEFGISNTDSYSIFPFWLFTIVWAILSYVLASLITVFFARVTMNSMPAKPSFLTPISKAPPAPAAKLPGYYILDKSIAGEPQYVYFGTEPPTLGNLRANPR
jgi:hypothetical protein